MRKKVLVFLGVIFCILIALFFYAPYFVVEVKNPLIELVRKSSIPTNIKLRPVQRKVTISHDGLQLAGVWTKSNRDTTKATIILVHGIRGNKGWWQTKSLVLADSGYQTIAVDLRGHGESEGKFLTYGVKEKEDLKAWVDFVLQEVNENEYPVGIWGQSLGGAVALQTLAVEDRLQFGVIESTFSDFSTVAADYGKDYMGFKIKPLTNNILNRAARLADFNREAAVPLIACESIKQPVLFIHGREDENIKMAYNEQNFHAIPHENKAFYVVEKADHYNVWNVGGEAYRERVFSFIESLGKDH